MSGLYKKDKKDKGWPKTYFNYRIFRKKQIFKFIGKNIKEEKNRQKKRHGTQFDAYLRYYIITLSHSFHPILCLLTFPSIALPLSYKYNISPHRIKKHRHFNTRSNAYYSSLLMIYEDTLCWQYHFTLYRTASTQFP